MDTKRRVDNSGPYDDCPYVYGYSSIDQATPDADQDGYSDSEMNF